jgi:hypothetical protein
MTMSSNKSINPNVRLTMWKLTNLLVSVGPILVWLAIKREEYFASTQGISNIIGIALAVTFISMIITKRTAALSGSKGFVLFFIIMFALETILRDLVLISGIAATGMVISDFITAPKVVKWTKIQDKTETAEINSIAMQSAIDLQLSKKRGRV